MDMWKEMMQLKLVVTIPAANRTKRQYAADKIDIGADEGVGPLAGGSCCSCQVGPPGPPGPPGRDGRPGSVSRFFSSTLSKTNIKKKSQKSDN